MASIIRIHLLALLCALTAFPQAQTPLTIYQSSGSATGALRMQERRANGQNYVGIESPQNVASDYSLIFPPALPLTPGECIKATTAGVLSFGACDSSVPVTSYDWTQTPGGSISVGTNNITLAPCPLGVAGAAPNLYVYLSGGVGAAEAVLIVGGTCTSGAASGTVQVTAANTHTGAWTAASASGGLREAILAIGNGASIAIPGNTTITLSAPFIIDKSNVTISGTGWSSVVQARASANLNTMLYIPAATGAGLRLRNFSIDGNRANLGTSILYGTLIALGPNGVGGINNITIEGMEVKQSNLYGISVGDMNNNISIVGNYIHSNGGGLNASDGGVGILIAGVSPNAATTNVQITNNYIESNYPTLTAAVYGGGIFFNYYNASSPGLYAITNNHFLNNFNNGGQLALNAPGVVTGNVVERIGSKNGAGLDTTSGIETSSFYGVISGNLVTGHSTGFGIALQGNPANPGGLGGQDTTIQGNTIQTALTCIGAINAGGTTRAIIISGNRASGCTTEGVLLGTGASRTSIIGNNFTDTTTPITDSSTFGTIRYANVPNSANFRYTTMASALSMIVECGQVLTVSGTATIMHVNMKSVTELTEGAGCELTLIPSGLWSLTTGGNIAAASTALAGRPINLVFDGSLWITKKPEPCLTCFVTGGNSFGTAAALGTNDAFSLNFKTDGANRWQINSAGMFVPAVHDAVDIGLTGTRVRAVYSVLGFFAGNTTITSGSSLLMDRAARGTNQKAYWTVAGSPATLGAWSTGTIPAGGQSQWTIDHNGTGHLLIDESGLVSLSAGLGVTGAASAVNFNGTGSNPFRVSGVGVIDASRNATFVGLTASGGTITFLPGAAPTVGDVWTASSVGGVGGWAAPAGQWTVSGADVYRASGNVGIGTGTSIASKLVVIEANRVIDGYGNINVFSSNTQAANLGGQIALGGGNGSGGAFDLFSFAVLKGAKENSTASNFAGYFAVATANSGGSIAEKFRITSGGLVGIMNNAPATTLDVTGTFNVTSTAAIGGLLTASAGLTVVGASSAQNFNGTGSNPYRVSGTTVIDASRNGTFVGLTASGAVSMSGSTIVASSTFSSDLIPTTSNAYVLGTAAAYWNQVRAQTIFVEGSGSIKPATTNTGSVGASTSRFNKAWFTDLDLTGTVTAPSGNTGLSVTKTVRAAGGAADCTLIYSGGLLTGGTC